MDERSVVTVFLTNAGETLLLRRSEDVGSYSGRWGGVAGHVEPAETPSEAARKEITEETGLSPDAVSLLAQGAPFTVSDADLDVRWQVHPFRFETASREVEPNWETAELRWVSPPEIRELPTVPELWSSWDRVRPTVESVAENATDGSATISRRALEVLRDEAALASGDGGWAAISAVASELKAARAAMAVVQVRVDRVMSEASAVRTPEAAQEAAAAGIKRAITADRQAAAEAASRIEGQVVFTLSRSGTVERTLRTGAPAAVRVAVSRPGGEGRALANALAAADHDVTLLGDANVPLGVSEAEAVLVGADTVCPNGDVINKAGTTAAALAAEREGLPVYVTCATAKISPTDDEFLDQSAGDLDADPAVTALDPPFERLPGDLVDGILTEDGLLDQAEVSEVAAEHAALAAWEQSLSRLNPNGVWGDSDEELPPPSPL